MRRIWDPTWTNRNSGSHPRRVVAEAEWTIRKAGPRLVVISLTAETTDARRLYDDIYRAIYCARGEMENRIKECHLDLLADRTSAAAMRAKLLRLWFASFAYVMIGALRRIGLAGTRPAQVGCGTIRLRLPRIAR